MAITIRDVAVAAGVSPMSVSKVLHDRGANVRVAQATAERIRHAAQELGYHPNSIARSFRSRRTRTIGLVSEKFSMHGAQTGYFSQLLSGITTATFENDYTLSICPRLVQDQMNGMGSDGRFDGVIWGQLNVFDCDRDMVGALGIPVVVLHSPEHVLPNAYTFIADNSHGLALAVDHLHQMGHRRVAFVIDPGSALAPEGVERINGFRDAMKVRGLEPTIYQWAFTGTDFVDFAKNPNRETALITFSEFQARILSQYAEMLGIRVPEQLSIVGFDSTTFCETSHPRLTAISQPIEQMAYDATITLLQLIEGEPPSRRSFVYPCGLDIRESTACPYLTVEVKQS